MARKTRRYCKLIVRFKNITTDGAILEVAVWKVPVPVPSAEHGYKYRAVYVVDGIRAVGFDSEFGKGDHCRIDDIEVPNNFTGVEQLIEYCGSCRQEKAMTERYLTITMQPGWKGALRAMGQAAKADVYQGEVLNFESPAHFFGLLSAKRWEVVRAAQGNGELSVRELARAVGRDVKRVHEDIVALAELGLLERTEAGGVMSPYTSMHIDMYLEAA